MGPQGLVVHKTSPSDPHWEGPQVGQEETVTTNKLQWLSLLNRKPFSNLLDPAPSGAFLENRDEQKLSHTLTNHSFPFVVFPRKTVFPHSLCAKKQVPSLFPSLSLRNRKRKEPEEASPIASLGYTLQLLQQCNFLPKAGSPGQCACSKVLKGTESKGGEACVLPVPVSD